MGVPDGCYVYSSPAISSHGSTVFVGSHDKKLYAIDAATGAKKWAFTTGGAVFSSPAISSDGSTVFVGSWDQKLYAIDASTGAKKWAFKTGGDVYSSTAISSDGSTVFVGSHNKKLYALTTGLLEWEAISNLAVSSTSSTREWRELKEAMAEWETAKQAEELAKAEWETAKAVWEEAKRAEEAAKTTVCERVVLAQKSEESAEKRAKEESLSGQMAQKECCICLERFATDKLLVVVRCGHRCVCAGCSGQLVGQPCPLCRKNVREVMRVFD